MRVSFFGCCRRVRELTTCTRAVAFERTQLQKKTNQIQKEIGMKLKVRQSASLGCVVGGN